MRDIELTHIADTEAEPPEPVDNAFVRASPGGVLSDTALTDPAMTDTKAYGRPSLGGEFGIARAAILGADADGGQADLATDTTVTVTPPVVPLPAYSRAGRSANNTSFLNLYPWFKTPKEGLDMNNPNPPPAADPPPPPPLNITGVMLSSNTGHAQFSGPATRDATITIHYALDGGGTLTLNVAILSGDTGTQIGAKVRNAVDAVFGLDASGTGGSVNVVGIGGVLTHFNATVS
jgi:hypothetical protein